MRILGLDEAGRGSVLGPLVIGAFCCEDGQDEVLREAGAEDSKMLSAKKRERIREALRPLGDPEVVEISAVEIDQGNLNTLEETAFIALIRKHKPDRVFIDAPVHPRGIPKLLKRLQAATADLEPVPSFVVEPKADHTYAVVGAASIFAKVRRDASMKELSAKHAADLGSGYPSDPKSRTWIKGFLQTDQPLPACVRTRWGTIENLRQQTLFGS